MDEVLGCLSPCPGRARARSTSNRFRHRGLGSSTRSPLPPLLRESSDFQECRERAQHARSVGCRSEEHTSELQSPDHLVCRLLLEKKQRCAPKTPAPTAFTNAW